MKNLYYHFISKKCQEDIAHTQISGINKYILPCWCRVRYFFKTLTALPPLSLLQFSLISVSLPHFSVQIIVFLYTLWLISVIWLFP